MTDQPRQEGELILYRTANDAVRVEVLYESETFWIDQRRLAALFGVDVCTVSEHLRNGYHSGELNEEATLRRIRIVRTERSREVARDIAFYNPDAIISVGDEVLASVDKVSAEVAGLLAEEQYDKCRVRQDREFESDFEAEVKRIEATRPRKRTEQQ